MMQNSDPIPFEEAFQRLMEAARLLPSETVPLADALGRVLATDVRSDIDMPPFDKAAMDGYACRRQDLALGTLTLIDDIPAGVWPREMIRPGTCARILTGAPVPAGADCVIRQEQTERQGNRVRILVSETAQNICPRGEDVRAGDVVLRRGERIGPAHLAVLAAVGATQPCVARMPRVTVLATGNELVEPSEQPGPAQIRNSNGPQLAAQLRLLGVTPNVPGIVRDQEDALTNAIAAAAETCDLVLLSGGVSTGDLDLVPAVLRRLGFQMIVESVAMQPGRPTVFATRGDTYACGLPGNPVSTYLVFELLVKPFLYRVMGCVWQPRMVEARVRHPIRRRKVSRQAAVPVRWCAPHAVEPVAYHGSAHIHALTQADGVVFIPVGSAGFQQGDTVCVRLFSA